MKNFPFLIAGLLITLISITGQSFAGTDNQTNDGTSPASATLNVSCSPELHELAASWTKEYSRLNPTLKTNLSVIADNQIIPGSNLTLITKKDAISANDNTLWKMVIGRDAIVPVMNADNPMRNEIFRQGISAETLRQLITDPQNQTWATMISGGQDVPIQLYSIDNEVLNAGIADFIKTNTNMNYGNVVANAEELISAIQKDIYAIGFCRLPDIRRANSNNIAENISLLPIDKNGNGRLDNFENIYGDLQSFTHGVWVGKYPNALCESIYAVSATKPTESNELAFLSWIMADGQQFLNPGGYIVLASRERRSNIEALTGTEMALTQTEKSNTSIIWLLAVLGLLFAGVIITAVARSLRKSKVSDTIGEIRTSNALNENVIDAPQGLYYDKTHTWAFMEKDGIVRVGIDDFLQHITGTLSGIKMKEPGETVRKGEKILTIIRDGKQLNVYAPVSGTIKAQNTALAEDSSLINSSPYTNGWVYMIEPKNWLREIDFLFMGERYKEWLKDEFTRLRDFFAASVRSNSSSYAHIVLQDGGELTDHVLADLEPEVWEDFQTKFIDTSR
jgi:glycine cleavage system H lipoate-binding protein/ABC-type phosphate transport system substrate-binding protein